MVLGMNTRIGQQVQIDAQMWEQIPPGAYYRTHPQGGIVVTYPNATQRWCRMDNGAYHSQELLIDRPPLLKDQPEPPA